MFYRHAILLLLLLITAITQSFGQEVVTGLSSNIQLKNKDFSQFKSKSAPDTLNLPFFDDFSRAGPYPDPGLWTDKLVFINNTYPLNQVTLGVATFDALDGQGLLYEEASSSRFSADTLTSFPLDMTGIPSDNFYLSFMYQPQGIADRPEAQDSLTLHFYSPVSGEWSSVWRAEGSAVMPFKPVIIRIDDPDYLARGFRFRFINYASLSSTVSDPAMAGNADHWHIDYLFLDRGRSSDDTLVADVAFTLPVRAPLNNYESMPWDQFREWYVSEQASSVTLNYRNNDSITRNVTRSFIIHDMLDDSQVYSSVQGATNVTPLQEVTYNGPLTYIFNNSNPDSALFMIRGILKTDDFDPKVNDTIEYLLEFKDYFSVDDGSSESGYGINGQGASGAMAVYRYRSFLRDSLRAVSICFNDSYLSSNQRYFDLVILEDNNGVPGDIIHAEEEYMVDPGNQINGFATYYFSDPVEVNGYFFVGWRQRSETFLNAGLDMNTPHENRQYYYLNGVWNASQVNGSLMIRPVMSKFTASGIGDTRKNSPSELKIWPNPARDIIYIDPGDDFHADMIRFVIFDSSGRIWMEGNYSESVSISLLPPGLYFIESFYGKTPKGFSKFIKIR